MPTTKRKKVVEPVIEPIEESEPITEELPPYAPDVEDTITFKRSHFFSALSVLTFFAGIFIGYVIWGTGLIKGVGSGSGNASLANGPVVEAPASAQPQYTRYKIPSDGFYSIGPADAPITIVEFSDYQCPFCRRWHQQVYEPLLAAYPGKIKLVYRNLPLTSIHPDAQAAAEAAMCAGEQNVYWQYHDKLFSGEVLGSGAYKQYAQELNLNMTSFDTCLSDHKYQAAIKTDSDFALKLGISSTPTFFINGLALIGAQPLDVFKQVIDKELAGEIPAN
ncbi:MAG: thioredoxin domain-containing protein [Chloroflexota bacterium]